MKNKLYLISALPYAIKKYLLLLLASCCSLVSFAVPSAGSFVHGGTQALTVCENSAATDISSMLEVTGYATGASITWSASVTPTHGTLAAAYGPVLYTPPNSTPVGMSYKPTAGYTGADAFTVQVSNGVATITTTINVTVISSPSAILGSTLNVCPGATLALSDTTAGGTWVSANTATASVSSAGVVSGVATGATVISYTLGTGCSATVAIAVLASPYNIAGSRSICLGLTSALSDTAGGVWSSSDPGTASIGSVSGIVSGNVLGLATITYIGPDGCSTSAVVTVNPLSAPVLGNAPVCPGTTTTLNDLTGPGIWTSANQLTATVGSSSGTVTGVTPGTTTITYTPPTGCTSMVVVTVNPFPPAIAGNTNVCFGLTTTLSDLTTGGTWGSSLPGTASVDPVSGTVTGNLLGTAIVTYTAPTGCIATTMVSVNPIPTAILGTLSVCSGSVTSVTDAATGGTWSSGDITIVAINGSTGIISGVNAGTATIIYTSAAGCSNSAIVTVNPLPGTILGTLIVCPGLSTILSDAAGSGTWTSANTAKATIDPVSGTITGVAAGTSSITFATAGTGCVATTIVTVGPIPSAISGPSAVCPGGSITLIHVPSGGTWSTGNSNITVNSGSGVVSALSSGPATITYTNGFGCIITTAITVNPLPSAIGGANTVCAGLSTTLSDIDAGGVWSTTASSGTLTLGSTGVVSGIAAGTGAVTYTFPTTCAITTIVTVNPLPAAITGTQNVCVDGAVTITDAAAGGSWSIDPSSTGFAAIDGASGTVSGIAAGTALITYTLPTTCIITTIITINPLPAAITGTMNACVGLSALLIDTTPGGTWISGNTTLATIGTSGMVTGVSAGAAGILYVLPTGCTSMTTFNVNPLPLPIAGNKSVCLSSTSTLSDAAPSGNWTITSTTGVAGVGLFTGVVSGFLLGVDTVIYTLPTGCLITTTVTVNPYPTAITGSAAVCQGYTINLSDSVTGGTWASSNTAFAPVNATTGVVSGVSAGVATISYTPTTGCTVTKSVTVNVLFPISGSTGVCVGSTTSLNDIAGIGTWASSVPIVATVNPSNGVVTGVSTGNSYITFTLATGCSAIKLVTVSAMPSNYTVTGGGSFCAGGLGLAVGLNGSDTGVTYTLYYSGSPMATLAGTGAALDFGQYPFSGTYQVFGTNNTTGCSRVMTGSATIIATTAAVPFVGLNTSAGTIVCVGQDVTYTTTTANGGSAPLYTWRVNDVVVASGAGTTYNYTPNNGDVVMVTLLSNMTCAAPDSATSSLTMTTIPYSTPSVTLAVSPGDSLCPGTPVTITPASVYGGAPVYNWIKNGVGVGSGPTYSFMPADGDNVICQMASSISCATSSSVFSSNNIAMRVTPIAVPIVSIATNPGVKIVAGESDTLIASVIFSGLNFSYQWEVNGAPISGATTDTFISNTIANHDVISCVVTGNSICGSATRSAEVTIVDTVGLSVHQVNTGISGIILSPNPNNGTFTVQGTLPQGAGDATIRIMDMLGRVVYEKNITAKNGKIKEPVQLTSVANGMYILELRAGEANRVVHFVVGQ